MNLVNKAFLCIIIAALTSCGFLARVEKRGYSFSVMDSHYDSLINSNASKRDIIGAFGSPTLVSFANDDLWIYYSEDVEYLLFLKGRAIDRKIITMEFDNSDRLIKLRKLSLNDEDKDFAFNKERTKVDYKRKGLLKRLFENVGQVKGN